MNETQLYVVEQIISALEYPRNRFPREALEAAMERRDEITPHLLEILRKVNDDIHTIDEEYWGHIAAMYLLALFRNESAFPLIAGLFLHDMSTVESVLGDIVTEDGPQILASTCGGNMELLIPHAENKAIYEWSRNAFLRAIYVLYVTGSVNREELRSYVISAFADKRFDGDDDEAAYTSAARIAIDLRMNEVEANIRNAIDAGKVDELFLSHDEVDLISTPDDSNSLMDSDGLIDRDAILKIGRWYSWENTERNAYAQRNTVDTGSQSKKNKLLKQRKKKKLKAIKLQRRKNR